MIAGYVHFYLQSISILKNGANLTAGTRRSLREIDNEGLIKKQE